MYPFIPDWVTNWRNCNASAPEQMMTLTLGLSFRSHANVSAPFTCSNVFGAAVPMWITHNEPWVAAFLGNWEGKHAPGLRDFTTALLVAHHILLSHGKAVQAHRQSALKSEIGVTLSLTPMYPASERPEDLAAATRNDGYWNRWFLDPVLRGTYP